MKRVGCLLLFAAGAWAQQEEPKISVNLEGFRYPPIARWARIQGDVVFQVRTPDVDLVIGQLFLTSTAQANLQTWDLSPFAGSYVVRYHFILTDPGTKRQMEPIGNKFDRFFLRLFGAPTKNVIEVCNDPLASDTRITQAVHREGDDYLIDIFVNDKWRCPETEVSAVAAGV